MIMALTNTNKEFKPNVVAELISCEALFCGDNTSFGEIEQHIHEGKIAMVCSHNLWVGKVDSFGPSAQEFALKSIERVGKADSADVAVFHVANLHMLVIGSMGRLSDTLDYAKEFVGNKK